MYDFTASKKNINDYESSKILTPEIGDREELAQFRGSLLALFGEPDYKTSDAENAFQYTITATDNVQNSYEITVYQGPSGLAIEGNENEASVLNAAQFFVGYVKKARPADFDEKLVYEDTGYIIEYGCKNGVCYYKESPQTTTTLKSNKIRLADLTPGQLNEINEIDFTKIKDPNDSWFWKEDLLNFSTIDFPLIRDLMRKDLSLVLGKPIGLDEVMQMGSDEGFDLEFSSETPEMALNALAEIWAWKTTAGKASQKRRLDCSSFAWTISRAVYGFYGGNLNSNHALANALYEEYEDRITSQEDTLRFFYALLELFKFKRLNE
ncbi:hypothetical protein [Paenibacillus sp. OK003]|uniref:hypothetical protein n=1 Tax=Paenibacillus sp. OK003 TaxID=1884380 RepID=UPI0008D2F5B4|nr:hypothetical protein [Paenibacillus sp. OK003]SEK61871.1 hypothetical protein SAMN05518856_103229 [Paenibacillus sp. OK003]